MPNTTSRLSLSSTTQQTAPKNNLETNKLSQYSREFNEYVKQYKKNRGNFVKTENAVKSALLVMLQLSSGNEFKDNDSLNAIKTIVDLLKEGNKFYEEFDKEIKQLKKSKDKNTKAIGEYLEKVTLDIAKNETPKTLLGAQTKEAINRADFQKMFQEQCNKKILQDKREAILNKAAIYTIKYTLKQSYTVGGEFIKNITTFNIKPDEIKQRAEELLEIAKNNNYQRTDDINSYIQDLPSARLLNEINNIKPSVIKNVSQSSQAQENSSLCDYLERFTQKEAKSKEIENKIAINLGNNILSSQAISSFHAKDFLQSLAMLEKLKAFRKIKGRNIKVEDFKDLFKHKTEMIKALNNLKERFKALNQNDWGSEDVYKTTNQLIEALQNSRNIQELNNCFIKEESLFHPFETDLTAGKSNLFPTSKDKEELVEKVLDFHKNIAEFQSKIHNSYNKSEIKDIIINILKAIIGIASVVVAFAIPTHYTTTKVEFGNGIGGSDLLPYIGVTEVSNKTFNVSAAAAGAALSGDLRREKKEHKIGDDSIQGLKQLLEGQIKFGQEKNRL